MLLLLLLIIDRVFTGLFTVILVNSSKRLLKLYIYLKKIKLLIKKKKIKEDRASWLSKEGRVSDVYRFVELRRLTSFSIAPFSSLSRDYIMLLSNR